MLDPRCAVLSHAQHTDYDKLEEHGPHKRHFRDHFVSENKDFDYFAYDLKLNF